MSMLHPALLVLLTGLSFQAGEVPDQQFRPDTVDWVPHSGGPVFTGTSLHETLGVNAAGRPAIVSGPDPASPGRNDWDNRIRERGWIEREGDLWRLWYTGYDGTKTGIRRLGLALSSDGIHWTRVGREPLLADTWVEDVCVARRGHLLEMVAEGKGDLAQRLTSVDGRHWVPQGVLDVRKADGTPIDAGPYGTPVLWFEGGVAHLFYERKDLGVWLARSLDMAVWTNVSDNPVVPLGPHPYDRHMIAMNQVVKVGSEYYAVMHGAGSDTTPVLWNTYFARSSDLIHWDKPQRAVFEDSANKSSGQLVHDGRGWRLYTMHDRVQLHWPANRE